MVIRYALLMLLATAISTGCCSPYHADRGALTGGLIGTAAGAGIGNQSGNAAEGAIVGAAIGALTGGAIGSTIDEAEARNRALIAAQMGREIPPGAVQIGEVVSMSQAGVSEQQIVTHIRAHGMAAPLTSNDLIALKQAGVPDGVVLAMQQPPTNVASLPPHAVPVGGPVFVDERFHPRCLPPRYPPYGRFGHPRYAAPGWSFGVGYAN